MMKKERRMKRQWKMIFYEMILGLIILKHSLGLLILSFGTPNPGLHYVPRKSILIERGYLDWRVFFLEKFFIINKAVVSFPQPTKTILINLSLIQDEFWIVKCIIGQSKKMMKKMKMERKNDSRVKTRKGSLEQKRENFWSLMGKANRRMKGQWPNSIWNLYEVLYLFQNQNLNPLFQNALPRIPESITVGLDACQITIFKD